MPPGPRSRYRFTRGLTDSEGRLYLTARAPYRFRNLPDNRFHTVLQGERLHYLAERYFSPTPDSAQLWWIIADFQPQPVLDPTLELTPGRILAIPSLKTVIEEIFNPARADEAV